MLISHGSRLKSFSLAVSDPISRTYLVELVARDLLEARQATAVILRRDTSDACLASSRSRATDSTRFVPDMGPDTEKSSFALLPCDLSSKQTQLNWEQIPPFLLIPTLS